MYEALPDLSVGSAADLDLWRLAVDHRVVADIAGIDERHSRRISHVGLAIRVLLAVYQDLLGGKDLNPCAAKVLRDLVGNRRERHDEGPPARRDPFHA